MSRMINVGIDLGTTNSLVAVFSAGQVEVKKHSSTHHDTLPSAVWLRKERIDVGVKAYTDGVTGDPENVALAFKRKMGTAERMKFRSTTRELSPVELSAEVLKELKSSHLQDGSLAAAVITIPASFDTVQSMATKQAGEAAGIRQVVLLQEPIAASLAFANKQRETPLGEGKWIVYDLGGGTFDAALLDIRDREMRVLDHEGNNYLGGSDFDRLIVERLLLPRIREHFGLGSDNTQFTSATGKHKRLYRQLLLRAEAAKKELSTRTASEVEGLFMRSEAGEDVEVPSIRITRSEFEELMRDMVDETAALIQRILTRNQLSSSDVSFVLMVGGSTYSPYVRRRVQDLLGIPVRFDVDPVTAIAVGAAFYAATKPIEEKSAASAPNRSGITIKLAFRPMTNEREELLAARVTGNCEGLRYRIVRRDGGYDSGLRPLAARINEDLPLAPDSYNVFGFSVVDSTGKTVEVGVPEIMISHGKYGILGQPLPEDICLEVDDADATGTALKLLFKKGTLLPAKKICEVSTTKTISKGSGEEIYITVLEGDANQLPATAKRLGTLRIGGSGLKADLRENAPIQIRVEMTESRTLTVSADLETVAATFTEIFDPKQRAVALPVLRDTIATLEGKIETELEKSESAEAFETSQKLDGLRRKAESISLEAGAIADDDVSDRRYQLEDQMRGIAREFHEATRETASAELVKEVRETLEDTEAIVRDAGNEVDQHKLADCRRVAESAILSGATAECRQAIQMLGSVRWVVLMKSPEFLMAMFNDLITNHSSRFRDQSQARLMAEAGKRAASEKDWDRLRDVNSTLIGLLPPAESNKFRYRTGIGG